MTWLSNSTVRSALAEVVLSRLKALDLPSGSASHEDAVRIGTTQEEASDLAQATEARLSRMGLLPAGAAVPAVLVCTLFAEAWNEAVRRSNVVPALIDWEDNGERGSDCTFLFGYLAAAKAAAEREG